MNKYNDSMKDKIKISLLIVILLSLDYFSKISAIDRSMVNNKIFSFFNILSVSETFVLNPGISFGIFSSISFYIKYIVFFVLIVMCILMHRKKYPFDLLLIFTGGLGNLVDRFLYQDCVVDFIEIFLCDYSLFICNVADIYINLGLLRLFLYNFLKCFKKI